MKKLKILILFVFLFNCFLLSAFASTGASYDLENGYIAVRSDVFNELVTNDRLVELYKEEIEYYKKSFGELKDLKDEKSIIQDSRISLLKDTISLKDELIYLKDDNIEKYKLLDELNKKEIQRFKTKSIITKLGWTALGAFAFSKSDSDGEKAGIAVATAYIWFK